MGTGELQDLNLHEEKCEYRVIQSSVCGVGNAALLKELCERMGKYEETMVTKEKEIAFVKYNLQEVKTKLNEKLAEVDVLKEQNKNIECELKLLQNKNQDLKQVEIKM